MKRIIGLKFNKISRCVNMLCLGIGNDVIDNEGYIYPEFNFHIQTSWRFVKGNQILLASRDIFLPQDEALASRSPAWFVYNSIKLIYYYNMYMR